MGGGFSHPAIGISISWRSHSTANIKNQPEDG